MKKFSLFITGILLAESLYAQEIITGLATNPVITNRKGVHATFQRAKSNKPVNLPFFDDFSSNGIYPDTNLWTNNFVFINSSYPKFPVSIGAATFDAINDTGAVYSWATPFGFEADHLTSRLIRLDTLFEAVPRKITLQDSLYFSFYYQPQGIGEPPNAEDSLFLEFFDPVEKVWKKIWRVPGTTLQDFYLQHQQYFKRVMIPILDSNYLSNLFQFRFYNYASIGNNSIPSWAGNVDQWHIDYVYLDVNRSINDTLKPDVTFVTPAQSVLKNYQAMPWQHFTSSEIKDSLQNTISNLDSTTYIINYKYDVIDTGGNVVNNYDGGNQNIDPFGTSGFHNWKPHTKPPFNYSFPLVANGKTEYSIEHVVKILGSVPDSIEQNDTIRFQQVFDNFFAYDDGTPEAGYGLSQTGAKLACRFTLSNPDTLRGVQMFFNHTYNNANQKFFYLTVWKSINPEQVLYRKGGIRPVYAGQLNRYHTYELSEPIPLSGTFYVGWEQTTVDNLNLGLDFNNIAKSNIFYNVTGNWVNTSYDGALMIRPLVGGPLSSGVGIDENVQKPAFSIYPNPLNSNSLQITIKDESTLAADNTISIYSISGRLLLNRPYAPSIDVSGLSDGLYMINIRNKFTGLGTTQKLIINR